MRPAFLACVLLVTVKPGSGAEVCGAETCAEGVKCYDVCQTPLCTGGVDKQCIPDNRVIRTGAGQQQCPNDALPVLYSDRLWLLSVHTCSSNSNCPDGRQCVNSACCPASVPVPAPASRTGGVTPNPVCPPLCRLGCRYGFQVDAKGCPMCACRPEPCENYPCPSGTKCKVMGDVDKCEGITCSNVYPMCVDQKTDCPLVTCRMLCPFGKEVDENGCELCGCKDICRDVVCPVGKKCQPHYPYNQSSLDGPQFSCVDTSPASSAACSPVSCRVQCPYGAKTDERGCELCQCNEKPADFCSTMVCPNNQICQMVKDSGCITGVCPKCVANAKSLTPCSDVKCRVFCQGGFEKDENGCDTCTCKIPKTCADLKCPTDQVCQVLQDCPTCEALPKCASQGVCSPVQCRLFCSEGFEKDDRGCDTCVCKKTTTIGPQTCSELKCSQGQACVYVRDCPTCSLRPVCLDLSGVTPSPSTATTTAITTTPPLTPRVGLDSTTKSPLCNVLRFFLTSGGDPATADKRLAGIC